MDIKNFPKTQKDFEHLEEITKNIINDDTPHIVERDWTQEEINLFVVERCMILIY